MNDNIGLSKMADLTEAQRQLVAEFQMRLVSALDEARVRIIAEFGGDTKLAVPLQPLAFALCAMAGRLLAKVPRRDLFGEIIKASNVLMNNALGLGPAAADEQPPLD